jgi:DNA-binding winged helix-turn-helix (wHTH) protein/uncharacterized DUF497 family protein
VASSPQPAQVIRFGIFELDLRTDELRKNGVKVKLQAQPFAILVALVMRAGELITREELYSSLSDHNSYDQNHGLNNAIQKIREALGDQCNNSRFIATLPGRGYRFLLNADSISRVATNGHAGPISTADPFLSALQEIRQEFLCTDSHWKLDELLYRINGIIDRYPKHCFAYEARLLSDQIRSAIHFSTRDGQNTAKHGISFELAAKVFDDPQALSLYNHSSGPDRVWYTLGQVTQTSPLLPQKVLLLISHYALADEDGEEHIQIRSARKATQSERRAYEKNKDRTDK